MVVTEIQNKKHSANATGVYMDVEHHADAQGLFNEHSADDSLSNILWKSEKVTFGIQGELVQL